MSRFKHMVFVCTNSRDPNDERGDCTSRGATELLDKLKALVQDHKLKGQVRVTKSGCLDFCAKGCTLAVFSRDGEKETWYTHATPADAEELFHEHILAGRSVTRLVEKV